MASSRPIKSTVTGTCPICQAPAVHDYRPFCSRRCADVDLSRWLTGAYAIPVAGADDDEDGEAAHESGTARSTPTRRTHHEDD